MFPLLIDYIKTHKALLYGIVGVVVLTIVGLLASLYYQTAVFQITNIDPKPPKLPTFVRVMKVTFNKEIETADIAKHVSISPSTTHSVAARGKELLVTLRYIQDANRKITVTLTDITSTSGDKLSTKLEYTVGRVEAGDQSEFQTEQQAKDSDSFEADYPLLGKMPIETLNYSITATFPNLDDPKAPIRIGMTFQPLASGPNGLPTQADYNAYKEKVRTYRTEAINKVKALKEYDPKKYRFVFSENVLIKEFGGTFVGNEPD